MEKSLLIITLPKEVLDCDYAVLELEYMLPSILHSYFKEDTNLLNQEIRCIIDAYSHDVGEAAAYDQYYHNMCGFIIELLMHTNTFKLIQEYLKNQIIIKAKISESGDTFLTTIPNADGIDVICHMDEITKIITF